MSNLPWDTARPPRGAHWHKGPYTIAQHGLQLRAPHLIHHSTLVGRKQSAKYNTNPWIYENISINIRRNATWCKAPATVQPNHQDHALGQLEEEVICVYRFSWWWSFAAEQFGRWRRVSHSSWRDSIFTVTSGPKDSFYSLFRWSMRKVVKLNGKWQETRDTLDLQLWRLQQAAPSAVRV